MIPTVTYTRGTSFHQFLVPLSTNSWTVREANIFVLTKGLQNHVRFPLCCLRFTNAWICLEFIQLFLSISMFMCQYNGVFSEPGHLPALLMAFILSITGSYWRHYHQKELNQSPKISSNDKSFLVPALLTHQQGDLLVNSSNNCRASQRSKRRHTLLQPSLPDVSKKSTFMYILTEILLYWKISLQEFNMYCTTVFLPCGLITFTYLFCP